MEEWFRLVGPQRAVELFGVRLVGINAETGKKLLITVALFLILSLVHRALRALQRLSTAELGDYRVKFWARQGVHLALAFIGFIGFVSIWFDDPTRLATALGLVTAGLAFALQKVIAALAGYVVILRGKTFNVGDRIFMGGVRGDVIALSFTQTTIMEMGQPPPVQSDQPAMWVWSRQYTGRVVTVSNARIFDEPVYNYSSDFPFIWEELRLPIDYDADRERAEAILLAAAREHTLTQTDLGEQALREMQRRYFIEPAEVRPRVYQRLTDDWLELTLRFVVREHGIREVKDALTRDVLRGLDAAGIKVASATIAVTRMPSDWPRQPPEQGGR